MKTTYTALGTCLLVLWTSTAYADDVAGQQPDAGPAADVTVAPGTPPAALEAQLKQTSDTSAPIHAGDTVTVTFEITHPAGATVAFPEAYNPDRWVLINAEKSPTADGERATSSTWVATFGIYRPGETTLHPFEILVSDATGAQAVLTTEPVGVKVLSIFADATAEPVFKDARPPVEVWVEDYTLAFVGAGALVMALLGLVGWWIRRRQLLQPPPPPPPRAAHEIALEKLSALAGDDLVERGEYMLYWVRLSEAIREYLGRSYGFPGTEFTTSEMLPILERVVWPTGLGFDDVRSFLRRCDEVKFGGAEPGLDESTATLRRAFGFVELTRPRIAAQPLESTPDGLAGDTEAEEEGVETVMDDQAPADRWAPPETSVAEEEE